jgi:hypothetical protein
VETRKCRRVFKGHTGPVYSVSWSPDGRFALSAGADRTIRLWNVSSGSCLSELKRHSGEINTVSWSPDGCLVLSGGEDGELRLWELEWELENNPPADWREGVRPYLKQFLSRPGPSASILPQNRLPTRAELTRALTRPRRTWLRRLLGAGRPTWTDAEFQRLLHTLSFAGYGWVDTEAVRRELTKMANAW